MTKQPVSIPFKIEMWDVKKIHVNKKNPRLMKRKEFDRLKEQIKKYPKMMWIRPPVVENDGKILGGNYRFKAALELGWKKVPIINASKLSETEKKNFILWDNENPGQWDFKELEGWKDTFNIDLPVKQNGISNVDAEMPIVPKFDEKYRAVLIVVETEMDFAHLCTLLDMGRERDYKTTMEKQTQVISFQRFMEKWEKRS